MSDATPPQTQPDAAEPAHGHGARLAGNSLANMTGRAASILFWVVVTPYVLHHLGPERFGLWSLLFVFTTYMLIMDLGVGSSLSRFAAELRAQADYRRLSDFVTTAGTFYLGLSTVIIVAATFFATPLLHVLKIPASLDEARGALILAAVGAAAMTFTTLMIGLLTGFQKLVTTNLISTLALVPSGVGIFLVLRGGRGLMGMLWVQIGVTILTGLAAGLLAFRDAPQLPRRLFGWHPHVLKPLLSFGLIMQITNMVTVMQLHVDKLFLTRWIGLSSVTPYELGFRVANGIMVIPILAFGAVTPAAAEFAARGDDARLHSLHVRGHRWTSGLALPLMALTCVAGPWLLHGWLGTVPGGSYATLCALAGALALTALTGTGTSILRGEGRPLLEMITGSLAFAVHVVVSLVLVPRIGLRGALIGSLSGAAAYTLAFSLEFHRRRGWSWLADWAAPLARPCLVAGALAAAGWGLSRVLPDAYTSPRLPALILGGGILAVGTALSLAALVALRHFENEDVAVIRRVAARALGRQLPRF